MEVRLVPNCVEGTSEMIAMIPLGSALAVVWPLNENGCVPASGYGVSDIVFQGDLFSKRSTVGYWLLGLASPPPRNVSHRYLNESLR